MKDRCLLRLGGITALSLATILGVAQIHEFFFPVQPEPGQSSITFHDDEKGRRICGPPEPTDSILEKVRSMGANGASSSEINIFLRRETEKLPPRCVTLFQIPH